MNYDDYAGLDVNGKAVLIFSHEPQENRRDSRLNGRARCARRRSRPRRRCAQPRGAGAASSSRSVPPRRPGGLRAVRRRSRCRGSRHPGAARARAASARRCSRPGSSIGVAASIDRDLDAAVARARRSRRSTTRSSSRGTAARCATSSAILPGVGRRQRRARPSSSARTTTTSASAADSRRCPSGRARFTTAPTTTRRARRRSSRWRERPPRIASRFPRSLVFVAFAGEERGLLGSAHYADNPAMPLATRSR